MCACVFTREVGGTEEVTWQHLVRDHGPGQVSELRQVSQHPAERRDPQTAVVVQQQRCETSQLTDGVQQVRSGAGELHFTEAELRQLMTQRKQEVHVL